MNMKVLLHFPLIKLWQTDRQTEPTDHPTNKPTTYQPTGCRTNQSSDQPNNNKPTYQSTDSPTDGYKVHREITKIEMLFLDYIIRDHTFQSTECEWCRVHRH